MVVVAEAVPTALVVVVVEEEVPLGWCDLFAEERAAEGGCCRKAAKKPERKKGRWGDMVWLVDLSFVWW